MENHKLVLPEYLNQYGFLFGGHLLQWIDECAWIAATLDYPGCNFLTIGMDKVEFKKNVRKGAILRINSERAKQGNTSVQYGVKVYRDNTVSGTSELIFTTNITFVRIDEKGNKIQLPEHQEKQ